VLGVAKPQNLTQDAGRCSNPLQTSDCRLKHIINLFLSARQRPPRESGITSLLSH